MKLTLKIIGFLCLITPVIQAQKLLELIDVEKAGIDFKNTIKESGKYNHIIWDYVYNGAGVAIGDINNDGLADIFFTGNQVNDRLYLNKGALRFQDISANLKSNTPHFWSAGVTMADVNADGWLDIYVCKFEPSTNKSERRNLLYINNHDLTFTERAEEFGLADTGYSVQSAFFDYDNDGDLDCFVVNQPPSNNIEKMQNRTSASVCTEYSNKLYRNTGGKYEDVTLAAGLESCSYGLGLAISDLNNDGWQDIYVSNDYFVSDFAFINQKNGTFLNRDKSLFKHESLYSMGVDIADFNNDGLADVFTADMSAADHYRNKANMASMNTGRFDEIIKNFNHQYMFNALQLNRGNGNFSEIAQLAGVANTDWSWSSLFIDIDNDSNKDLFVTNGIKRDIRFVDGMNKTRDMMASGQIKLSEIINNIPSQKLPNYAFQNKRDLHFENKSADWGFDQPSFSNGMAYGDLDNDGDLDLVVNNVEDLPFIYKNNSTQNYLRIKLEGEKNNTFGYGAKAIIYASSIGKGEKSSPIGGGGGWTVELNPTRGFLSSSEPILHFGLGNIEKIDSVVIIWNDKSRSKLTNIKANQVLKISQKTAKSFKKQTNLAKTNIFQEKEIVEILHQESTYNDFAKEVLLPNKLSEIGPALAVADANGDGLDDIFVGGGKGQNSRLLFQKSDGCFNTETFDDANQEKTKALFFDANKDGHLDLYVANGSNEFPDNSPDLQDKLYINQNGKFVADTTALPQMLFTTGAVAISNIDKNDKQFLFVGGLMQQQKYPFPAESYLSLFDRGKIQSNAPIEGLGAVRDAIWTDFDNDGDQDLIAVGEWTNIQILENIEGKLIKKTVPSLEKTTGFWHSIKAKDFDNDGDEDYVLGNLGLNNKFKKDAKKKFHVFSADFDENGVNDVVLAKVDDKGTLLPVRGRECSSQQMPFIAQKIKTFDEFAKSTLNEIYTPEKLSTALHYEINEMGSIYVENLGNGNFQYKLLPTLAQFSVITDMLIEDFDHDGKQDVLAVGNKYEAEVETARYDASLGIFLKGDGKGNFQALEVNESGFSVNENSRNLAKIKIKDKNYVVVGVNNGKFKFFEIR